MTATSSTRLFFGSLMTLLILDQTTVCLVDERVAVQPTTTSFSQSTEAMNEIINATYQELIQPHPCGDNDPFCPTYCYWCHIHFGETSMECLQTMLVDECIRQFEMSMLSRNSSDWCLWSKVSGVYSNLSHCTEKFSDCLMIPWPNPLVEQTFVGIHSQYFADCPTEELIDPPPGIIFALVITPICLIPIMVSLVVLKTKNGDGSS